jgi:phosphate transport system substrate-binding protein
MVILNIFISYNEGEIKNGGNKMKKILFVILGLSVLTLVSCKQKEVDYTKAEKEELIVKAFVSFMETSEGKATIQGKGGIVLVTATDKSWDEVKENHPVTKLDNSDITIKFGGSTSVLSVAKALSVQFSPLAGNFIASHEHTGSGDAVKRTVGTESESANKIHIGFASRDFSDDEKKLIGNKISGRLAYDAVVAIANLNNLINDVSKETLTNIYNGTITNFNQISGDNLDIKVYTRDTTSGTREAFFSGIGFKKAEKDNAVLVNGFMEVESNGAMLTNVKNDLNGLGYASLSSIENSGVKGLSFEGVIASTENVLNNTYQLKRPFMFVTRY